MRRWTTQTYKMNRPTRSSVISSSHIRHYLQTNIGKSLKSPYAPHLWWNIHGNILNRKKIDKLQTRSVHMGNFPKERKFTLFCSSLVVVLTSLVTLFTSSRSYLKNRNANCHAKTLNDVKRNDNNDNITVVTTEHKNGEKTDIPATNNLEIITRNEAINHAKDLCQRIKDEVGSPGLVVAVSVDGEELWMQGLGYADVENRVPCSPESNMRIASISKPITMTIIAKLYENGMLDLHKPVQHYVNEWPEKTFQDEKVEITTHHLISHMSGVRHYDKTCKKKITKSEKKETSSEAKPVKEEHNDTKKNVVRQIKKNPDEDYDEFFSMKNFPTVTAALALFKNDKLCSKPGTEYRYSTHAWTLASAVVEGASGKDFKLLMRNLLKDLGMNNTYIEEAKIIVYNRARYYEKKKGRLVNTPYVDNSYKWAGGGLTSTVGDLIKFGNVMLYSYHHDETLCGCLPGYLKRETVTEMWTPIKRTMGDEDKTTGYGLGWCVAPELLKHGKCGHQRFYVYHTGGAMGASSVLLLLPPDSNETHKPGQVKGVVVAILTNVGGVGLTSTALKIAKKFEQIKPSKKVSAG